MRSWDEIKTHPLVLGYKAWTCPDGRRCYLYLQLKGQNQGLKHPDRTIYVYWDATKGKKGGLTVTTRKAPWTLHASPEYKQSILTLLDYCYEKGSL